MDILSFAVEERSRGEGQGVDADFDTRSGGDADLHMSLHEKETGEIKVEVDMAVDPLCIFKYESQSYSKLSSSILISTPDSM